MDKRSSIDYKYKVELQKNDKIDLIYQNSVLKFCHLGEKMQYLETLSGFVIKSYYFL